MATLQGQSERTVTQVAPSPVDLNQRLDIPRAGMSVAGVVIGALLFAAGAGLYSLGAGRPVEYRGAGGWIATITGGGLSIAGAGVFVLAFWYLAGIVRYELKARWIWTEQQLKERNEQGGLIIEEERTSWALHVDNPDDMILIAIYIYMQARAGRRWPWSVDSLKGDLYLDNGNKARLLGTLSEHEARKVGQELVRMGVVRGRSERSAGVLAVDNADQLLERVWEGMK